MEAGDRIAQKFYDCHFVTLVNATRQFICQALSKVSDAYPISSESNEVQIREDQASWDLFIGPWKNLARVACGRKIRFESHVTGCEHSHIKISVRLCQIQLINDNIGLTSLALCVLWTELVWLGSCPCSLLPVTSGPLDSDVWVVKVPNESFAILNHLAASSWWDLNLFLDHFLASSFLFILFIVKPSCSTSTFINMSPPRQDGGRGSRKLRMDWTKIIG